MVRLITYLSLLKNCVYVLRPHRVTEQELLGRHEREGLLVDLVRRVERFLYRQADLIVAVHAAYVAFVVVGLILILIGALPTWPYSSGWGYYPSGGLGLVLLIVVVLLLTGRL